ncbi:DNA methyltransferase [Picrophilus oshimae]|uniref:Methyltransferase n=1 Tax=Picrophilus torridus (strain ATCC 700027 / DSM 9790 / JCM 10055 / NBRC 100828 / KAW 2/3) TaxID=1122961 RepID=Q6L205_PICTO|nr:DNA methyltransferase [Picrophilus oshimae]AAT42997.1 methyltransferase [Picrophilus oshimae DSM 9789]
MSQNKYLIETSKENYDIVSTELKAISETFLDFNINFSSNGFFIISGSFEKIRYSGFVNNISNIIYESNDYKDFPEVNVKSFYVRVVNVEKDKTEALEREIGRIIKGKSTVSFNNPEGIYRAVKLDKWYLCRLVYSRSTREFESRRAPLRPFFSPVSMHPKYARYLVNMTFTKENETILDPFCGTGGILIEAALTGRKIIGNDYLLSMVTGTKMNLKYYNIYDYKIYNKNIEDLYLDDKINGIATDMPYGRSSSVSGNIEDLYNISFEKFNEFLIDHGKCAIVINDTSRLIYSKKYFKILFIVPVYQHRSLTRYFVTLEKI